MENPPSLLNYTSSLKKAQILFKIFAKEMSNEINVESDVYCTAAVTIRN